MSIETMPAPKIARAPSVPGTELAMATIGARKSSPWCFSYSGPVELDRRALVLTRESARSRPAFQRGKRSGLRLLRPLRLGDAVERDCSADERLEGRFVDHFAFVNIDRATHVPLKTGVEQACRIFQRGALREGQFHDEFVG